MRVPEITPVPNAPDHIEGVINLRGKIIAVVDLSKRFGEGAIERNSKSRIVVVEMEDAAGRAPGEFRIGSVEARAVGNRSPARRFPQMKT